MVSGEFRKLEWEIIVVDDASPDGTQEIARQLARVYGEEKIASHIYIGCTRTLKKSL